MWLSRDHTVEYIYMYTIFIYLAASDLSCGMRTLSYCMWDLVS